VGTRVDLNGFGETVLPLPAFEPRTVQPVASCYIDYVIPALQRRQCRIKLEYHHDGFGIR